MWSLAREAFSRMGYAPEFVFINWEDKKNLLAKGSIDCIWSSFTMTDREDEYHGRDLICGVIRLLL